MTVLIDPPSVLAHGRFWSHLVSDASYDELHAFAARAGVPRRGFDRDHYDVPGDLYDALVSAGAVPVSSRELVMRLAGSGLRMRKSTSLGRRRVGKALVRPPRLHAGDVVAVVAPAGPVPEDRLDRGLEVLRGWGLDVREGAHVRSRHRDLGYLAGSDEQRAADLMRAWLDPDVRAVFAARGGYGVHRMLDLLDHDALGRAGAKALVGFSDLTALHQSLSARIGLATVHGPVVTSLGGGDDESREHLRRLLFEPAAGTLLARMTTVVPGVADGVLVGGNLALLTSSVGTGDARPAAHSVVLLEDVGEDAYRVDRMVTHLVRSGWFDRVAGIVVGDFSEGAAGQAWPATSAGQVAVVVERLAPLGVPMVTGAPVGHQPHNLAVPLGVPARLDATAGTLALLVPPLV